MAAKNQDWMFWLLALVFLILLFLGLKKKAAPAPVQPAQPKSSAGTQASAGSGGISGTIPKPPQVIVVPQPDGPTMIPPPAALPGVPGEVIPNLPIQPSPLGIPNPGDYVPPDPVGLPGQDTSTVRFVDPGTGVIVDTACDPADPSCSLLPLPDYSTIGIDPSAGLTADLGTTGDLTGGGGDGALTSLVEQ